MQPDSPTLATFSNKKQRLNGNFDEHSDNHLLYKKANTILQSSHLEITCTFTSSNFKTISTTSKVALPLPYNFVYLKSWNLALANSYVSVVLMRFDRERV